MTQDARHDDRALVRSDERELHQHRQLRQHRHAHVHDDRQQTAQARPTGSETGRATWRSPTSRMSRQGYSPTRPARRRRRSAQTTAGDLGPACVISLQGGTTAYTFTVSDNAAGGSSTWANAAYIAATGTTKATVIAYCLNLKGRRDADHRHVPAAAAATCTANSRSSSSTTRRLAPVVRADERHLTASTRPVGPPRRR